jgi:hypothetical protein
MELILSVLLRRIQQSGYTDYYRVSSHSNRHILTFGAGLMFAVLIANTFASLLDYLVTPKKVKA